MSRTPALSEARTSVRRLMLLGIGVACGILLVGAAVLLDARADAWKVAERSSANLAETIERDIARNVSVYDLSLQGALDALDEPGIDAVSPGLRHAAVFDRAASAEYLGSMLVLDAQGNVVLDSTSVVPHTLNLADRDYFLVHQRSPDAGLFLSRPFLSRLRNGDASISISRRRNGPHGEFAGIVVGTLRIAYFDKLFSMLDLGPGGSVFLVRSDGRMVARQPPDPPVLDRDMHEARSVRAIVSTPAGTLVSDAALDGVRRFYTYRQIGDLPLHVAVGVSTSDILAGWWRKAVGIGIILGALATATVVVCVLFGREVARREVAERALVAAVDRLAISASTDDLTGLPNRRAFQVGYDLAWRQAARTGASLALLIIDVDCFKLYNDRYGHQAGDDVLRRVARCLRDQTWRPGDTTARHGGEEFAVVLPSIDEDGAVSVAERMRHQLASLGIAHADGPAGCVTISIGVAIGRPALGDAPEALFRAADGALYGAKRAGRNRVHRADRGPARPSSFTAVSLAAD